MFLAHLLRQAGVDALVLEARSREYVEGRVRAGVLEQNTVRLMHRLGVGDRVAREGLVHAGTTLCVDGEPFHVDFADLTDGGAVTVYGQSEVMKDLNDAADRRGIRVIYDTSGVTPRGLDTRNPTLQWTKRGDAQLLECDFVVGCDGYHGIS